MTGKRVLGFLIARPLIAVVIAAVVVGGILLLNTHKLWVPEDNPNGPGGSGSTVEPPDWQTRWNAAVAQAPNWTLDDFYS